MVPCNPSLLKADCIILAAGLASRMGASKLDLLYRGKTLLDWALDHALEVSSHVILVTGYRGEGLQKRYCQNPQIQVVDNPHYQKGLLSSLQAALNYLKHLHFFVSHADMPHLYPHFYRALWSYRTHDVVFIGTPDLSGHPVLLSQKVVPRLQKADWGLSTRQVLSEISDTHYLGLSEPQIYQDIDTPEDYQNLLANSKTMGRK